MEAILEVRKSEIYGMGCFALVPFQKRKKIAAYEGEVIKGRRRIEARLRGKKVMKIIWIGDSLGIDGAVGGNETAYINHSCEPNAYMRIAPGDRILFFALRDIKPGEELTIDYRDPDHPRVCRCGAKKCRSNRQSAETTGRKNAPSTSRKKRQASPK